MFSPDVQHQGKALANIIDWIIHQPRMLLCQFFKQQKPQTAILEKNAV